MQNALYIAYNIRAVMATIRLKCRDPAAPGEMQELEITSIATSDHGVLWVSKGDQKKFFVSSHSFDKFYQVENVEAGMDRLRRPGVAA